MFEDSTFESAGKIHTRSRTWGLVALAFNTLILAALVTIPLIYPEALPKQMLSFLVTAPPPVSETPKAMPQQQHTSGNSQSRPQFVDMRLSVPRQIPGPIRQISDAPAAPGGDRLLTMDTGVPNGIPFGMGTSKPPTVVHEEPRGPVQISRGVAEGLLIQRIVPRYPAIAVASRTQGTVTLQAIISKDGTIQGLHVVSGSPMLQQAAIDAVRQWRYRPFLLNGQPVDVETTINVVFSLGQ